MWTGLLTSLVLVVGLLPAPADPNVGQLLGRAVDADDVAEVVRTVDEAGFDLARHLWDADKIVQAWERVGAPERGLALLEALAPRTDPRYEPSRLLIVSQHHERQGRLVDAVASCRAALAAANDNLEQKLPGWDWGGASLPHVELARLLEAHGDHVEALGLYETWRGHSAGCGLSFHEVTERRALGIARCKEALGDVDAALDGSFALSSVTGGWGPSRPAMLLHCEIAVRHVRLAATRTRVEALAADVRILWAPYLEFASAAEKKDHEALLRLASTSLDGRLMEAVARTIAGLGQEVLDDLARRIVRGESVALQIASAGRIRALRAAVLSRRALVGRGREAATLDALARELE